MAQLARLSPSCLGTGALSDTAQPLPHVYAIWVGFPWNKSYDSILQCWSCRDSLCTKRMGIMLLSAAPDLLSQQGEHGGYLMSQDTSQGWGHNFSTGVLNSPLVLQSKKGTLGKSLLCRVPRAEGCTPPARLFPFCCMKGCGPPS